MSDCDKQSLRKTCVHVFVDNMQLLSILERQQFWILSLRACSKHAVQPICAVQDEICAVQNEKLCSPKTQSWRHHCAVFQEYIDNYLSIYLSIYLSKKSRLGRRKCRNTTRAPQKFSVESTSNDMSGPLQGNCKVRYLLFWFQRWQYDITWYAHN